ncbi:MAG: hypothetical protein GXO89_08240 [Chlorobi bacterium]|nr:hypothetical protein [Chlorobiota bacterium]
MIKRASHIVLVIILMVSTTGVAFSKHYMMGELFDVSIIGDADHCCTIPCDCCDDEFEFHKLEVKFIGSDVQVTFNEIKPIDLLINTLFFDVEAEMDILANKIEFANNHPPPKDSFAPTFTQSFLL